jgi:hypothetical protein
MGLGLNLDQNHQHKLAQGKQQSAIPELTAEGNSEQKQNRFHPLLLLPPPAGFVAIHVQ